MQADYQIVRYRPEFKRQVVDLWRYLWTGNPALNEAYLEWKYEQNPYLKTPLIHLALCDGRVVGMRGLYGAKWEIGQPAQVFLGPCASDLVIAPEHRNRGLMAKIMRAAADDLTRDEHEHEHEYDYPYVFNLSANLTTQLASLTAGWRSVGPLDTALFQSRWARLRAGALRRPFARPFARWFPDRWAAETQPFAALDRHSRPGRRGLSRFVAVEPTPRPAAMAELIERLGSDGRLRQVRDREYFAWRFRSPMSWYRFLFWADTTLEGYLVLRYDARGRDRWASIVDWEATNPSVRADLLRTALRWSKLPELSIWTSTLPAEAQALLREAGFHPLRTAASLGHAYRRAGNRPSVLVRAARPELLAEPEWTLANLSLADLRNWDLRMTYSDLV